MNRFAIKLLVITSAFIFGVAITFSLLKMSGSSVKDETAVFDSKSFSSDDSYENLPILSYCEIVDSPKKYSGEIIRLKEILHIGDEGNYFYDLNCNNPDKSSIVKSTDKEVLSVIEKAREQKDKKALSRKLELTVIGKFKNETFRDCCVITPFQFEILKVEKATAKD